MPLAGFCATCGDSPGELALCSGCNITLFCGTRCEIASSSWHAVWCDAVSTYVASALRAASEGDPRAQLRAGLLLQHGLGVKEDAAEAVLWFNRAAANGNADALYELGRCHDEGRGVVCDVAAAALLYDRAARAGSVSAMVALGRCFECGRGVTLDVVAAAGLFQRVLASETEDAGALFDKARYYDLNLGVAVDKVQSALLYRSATQAGLAAQQRLRHCPRECEGGAADIATSFAGPQHVFDTVAAPMRLLCKGY